MALTREQKLEQETKEEFEKLVREREDIKQYTESFRSKVVEFYRDNQKRARQEGALAEWILNGRGDKIIEPLHRLLHACLSRFSTTLDEIEIERKVTSNNALRHKYNKFNLIVAEFDIFYGRWEEAKRRQANGNSLGVSAIENEMNRYITINLHRLLELSDYVHAKTVVFTGMQIRTENPEAEEMKLEGR